MPLCLCIMILFTLAESKYFFPQKEPIPSFNPGDLVQVQSPSLSLPVSSNSKPVSLMHSQRLIQGLSPLCSCTKCFTLLSKEITFFNFLLQPIYPGTPVTRGQTCAPAASYPSRCFPSSGSSPDVHYGLVLSLTSH